MSRPSPCCVFLFLAASLAASVARAATPEQIKACDSGYPEEKKIAACTKLVNNERETVDVRIKAFLQRAWAHSYRMEAEAAYADAGEAIKLDPKRSDSYDTRARIMANIGEIDRPIADYTAALELKPKYSYFYTSRGDFYRQKGDQQHAIADFKKAIELMTADLVEHPDWYFTYKSRSDAYRNVGEIDKALADFSEFMKLKKPTDYSQIGERGDLYLRKRDFAHAIADYTEAINKEPTYTQYRERRALAYRLKGDTAHAILDYDFIINGNVSAEAYIGRGLAYAAAGKPQRAVVDFTKAIDIFPESDTAYYDRAQAQRDSGNVDLAISDYSAAIERNPRYAVAFNSRGRAYLEKNDTSHALADFNKAIELDDKLAAAYYNRAQLYQSKNKPNEAILDFGRAIALDPANKDFLVARASAFGAKGAHPEAEADFTAALVIDPVDPYAYVGRAAARLKQGAAAKALADADRALLIDKALPAVYRIRADIDAALGQKEKAAADRIAGQRAQAKRDEKERAARVPAKMPPMKITIVGQFQQAPASMKLNYNLNTVVEITGDEIIYKVKGMPAYKIASGDRVEDKFPGLCNGKQTSNIGERSVTAAMDRYLVHIQLQSHLDFRTGACRGQFNDYRESFLIDVSDGGCKFTYLQNRSLLGNSDFGANILDQQCKAEVINLKPR